MGLMRFITPDRRQVAPETLRRAYLAGMEGIPWHSRIESTGDGIRIVRNLDDSGHFHIPWRVPGYGELMLSTTCLMQRERPYVLPVELARGTLFRLRNQWSAWQSGGLLVAAEMERLIHEATANLGRAVTMQEYPAAAAGIAEEVIRLSLEAAHPLAAAWTEFLFQRQRESTARRTTIFAPDLEDRPLEKSTADALLDAFNAGVAPLKWSQVEQVEGEYDWSFFDQQIRWCRRNSLKVCGGPLLRLATQNLPDWLYLWEDDFDTLKSYVVDYVRAAVEHFRGKVHLWYAAAGMNVSDPLSLSEEKRLRLTVAAIESIRRIDPRTPVIVSFDQPWAEYLAHEALDLSPLHFADALVRADLGLAGLGLEINFGYWPGGTPPRDLLEISRLVDRWTSLGLPLLILLTAPSGKNPEPSSTSGPCPVAGGVSAELSPESQRDLAAQLVPLLLSKPAVQGIIWNQLHDRPGHGFPHGGLFDAAGRAKPVLAALAETKRRHLGGDVK